PLLYRGATLSQGTVLAAGNDAVMVVQEGRSALVVNSGTDSTAFYTVVPFLRQAGVNQLASAIHGDDSDSENWRTIADRAPIRKFYGTGSALTAVPTGGQFHQLNPNQVQPVDRQRVQALQDGEAGLRLTLLGHTWLLLPQLSRDRQMPWIQAHPGLQSEVLWWHGEALSEAAIATINPRIAIASARTIDPDTEALLKQKDIQVFCTERDGAIIWGRGPSYRAYLASPQHPAAGFD
ncbi:MAG: hypothetical protein WBA99_11390, partial [Nodosilinea sp.]